ncbi:MAG: hypothetical protein J3Q66DRAFT_440712 [Benniella sp.]|nr:MAG: hypothetical protein J3Q66DRAFT_440712 [Benniella sp.]
MNKSPADEWPAFVDRETHVEWNDDSNLEIPNLLDDWDTPGCCLQQTWASLLVDVVFVNPTKAVQGLVVETYCRKNDYDCFAERTDRKAISSAPDQSAEGHLYKHVKVCSRPTSFGGSCIVLGTKAMNALFPLMLLKTEGSVNVGIGQCAGGDFFPSSSGDTSLLEQEVDRGRGWPVILGPAARADACDSVHTPTVPTSTKRQRRPEPVKRRRGGKKIDTVFTASKASVSTPRSAAPESESKWSRARGKMVKPARDICDPLIRTGTIPANLVCVPTNAEALQCPVCSRAGGGSSSVCISWQSRLLTVDALSTIQWTKCYAQASLSEYKLGSPSIHVTLHKSQRT